METRLKLDILPQPDGSTCGPTCLHALYRYHHDPLPLEQLVAEVTTLDGGGTLAVHLGSHALKRGYRATLFTYHLQVFDPTWFAPSAPPLSRFLEAQLAFKESPRLTAATHGYLEFLRAGGEIRMEDLTAELIRRYLRRRVPILTGLSATYLYRSMREFGPDLEPDAVRGLATGHFVVLCGYDRETRNVLVADPLLPNPISGEQLYELNIDRVVNAILLGILTYDANLLVLEPGKPSPRRGRAHRHRGQ